MSKNVVSASSHPIPLAAANQRPFHIPFWRWLEVTFAESASARNESGFLHLIPIAVTYTKAVDLARKIKICCPQLCSFVCTCVHNLS